MSRVLFAIAALCLASALSAEATGRAPALSVTSAAVTAGTIAVRHSGNGGNRSPDVAWSQPPTGTKSLVLILDDPDAGPPPFVHWVVTNLPATTRGLPAAEPDQQQRLVAPLPVGARVVTAYEGPSPPPGTRHTYVLAVYALDLPDVALDAKQDWTRAAFMAAYRRHILASGEMRFTWREPTGPRR